jgi:ribonuclease P protein component
MVLASGGCALCIGIGYVWIMDRVFEDTAPSGGVKAPSTRAPQVGAGQAQRLTQSYGDEKNLPTEQSATQTNPRLSRAHGDADRAQRAQAPARQGSSSADGDNSSKATRVTARGGAGFARHHRLRRRADFLRVQRHGLKRRTSHFVVQMLSRFDAGGPKLGITISRRIGNAVRRNRLKRRVRECFRVKLKPILPPTAAVVVIGLAGAGELDFATIDQQLTTAVTALAQKCES